MKSHVRSISELLVLNEQDKRERDRLKIALAWAEMRIDYSDGAIRKALCHEEDRLAQPRDDRNKLTRFWLLHRR